MITYRRTKDGRIILQKDDVYMSLTVEQQKEVFNLLKGELPLFACTLCHDVGCVICKYTNWP